MKKYLFFVSLIVLATQPLMAKKTVCSLTLNSADEREFFKAKLSPQEYNFVELVPPTYNAADDTWLDRQCRPDLNCDVLLVSGHFAGVFFGRSKYELSLEKMEQLSCSKKCDGIFRYPKEVYLYGCNTLAGKNQDSRTPEQYYADLIRDRLSPLQAQQAVAIRYSPLGNSNSERMQRIFAGVPRIYGFQSKAPLGHVNKNLLNTIFPRMGSFSDNIDNANREKNIFLEQNVTPDLNMSPWVTIQSGIYPKACSGSHPQDSALQLICTIHNAEVSTHERLMALKQLFSREDGKNYILVAHAFLKETRMQLKSAADKELVMQIFQSVKPAVDEMIPMFENAPNLRLKLVELAYFVGWMNFEEFQASVKKPILNISQKPVTATEKTFICSYDHYFTARLRFGLKNFDGSEFHPSYYENMSGLSTFSCLRVTGEAHITTLLAKIKNTDSPLYLNYLEALAQTESETPRVQQVFIDLLNSNDPNVVAQALQGVAATGIHDEVTLAKLKEFLNSPNYTIRSQAEGTLNYLMRGGIIPRQ